MAADAATPPTPPSGKGAAGKAKAAPAAEDNGDDGNHTLDLGELAPYGSLSVLHRFVLKSYHRHDGMQVRPEQTPSNTNMHINTHNITRVQGFLGTYLAWYGLSDAVSTLRVPNAKVGAIQPGMSARKHSHTRAIPRTPHPTERWGTAAFCAGVQTGECACAWDG